MSKLSIKTLISTIVVMLFTVEGNASVESEATQLLIKRNAEFEKQIIQLSDNIYTAVGYGVSPISMIEGADGIIIIDTGIDANIGQQVREKFREITVKPVKGIIFTHGHGDHTGGAIAFKDNTDVAVWAHHGYGHEASFAHKAGLTIQQKRGARQGGFLLLPEQRINNGVAQAYWPKRKGGAFDAASDTYPTDWLRDNRQTISIAGIELQLVAAAGETDDQLYVYYPGKRALFSGDNFYKSWPNIYPIRGVAYRDVGQWIKSLEDMLKEKPSILVGGHTRPILGTEKVAETLSNYHEAISFLFNKTIEGMNLGLTPNQLVDYVILPDKFKNVDYLKPYYGHPEWAIRSIFNGYLGWFDGNPSNLFPLSDKELATRTAELAGGVDVLIKRAEQALLKNDPQWAAQLCDHILALEPNNKETLQVKAKALTKLAESLLTATGRNYYLTVAKELINKANKL
ncbi:alkyl sulfatase dimerization domain-containing protein [Colwellia sp. RE-S-Sl-9]